MGHSNNQKQYDIRVVNLSLGHPVGESYTTDPICQAVEARYKAGIVVVCAAGNDGRVNGSTNTAGLDNEGWGTAYGSIQSPGQRPVCDHGRRDQEHGRQSAPTTGSRPIPAGDQAAWT